MTETAKTEKRELPQFVAIKRILKLPVVSSGVEKATYIYVRVKSSNRVFEFSLDKTEKTVFKVIDLSVPLVIKLEDPINKIDDLLCKSLDIVEQNLPIVTYTPEEIYFTTKTYVKAKVEPVLKRADSVKQLSMLDDALSVADKYVDKYLPDKDPGEDVADKPSPEPSSQTVKTIRHVNHFSRKLQRRLTRRTIAEAKLLKKQGYDTVQCFVHFADLLAKDPKKFAEQMQVIWKNLSQDEPENQKPPENIEQLIEMLSREGARRFVHVTNFVVKNVSMAPAYAKSAFAYTTHEAALLADKLIKYAHLEKAKGMIVDVTNKQMAKYNKFVSELIGLMKNYLSSVSSMLKDSKKPAEAEKDNETNAAKANESNAAKANESNAAKANESNAAKANESNAAKAKDSNAAKANESNAAKANESNAAKANESNAEKANNGKQQKDEKNNVGANSTGSTNKK